MRVFLAIDVSPAQVEQIVLLQKQVAHPCVKLTDSYHITLAFFGDVSVAELLDIRKKLSSIVCPKMNLTTATKIGCFSNWNRLRVIFLNVMYNKTLNQLAIKISNLFPAAFDRDGKFVAHITLGRVKQEIVGGEYATFLQSIDVTALSWKVEELVLYESILEPSGPVYKRLGCVKLN
jgi:2'-5' RNA ligase